MSNNDQAKKTQKAVSYYTGPGADVDIGPMHSGPETTRRIGGATSFQPALPGFDIARPSPEPAFVSTQGTKQAPLQVAPPAFKTKTTPPPAAFVWSLQDVPTLPEFHPLERTAIFIVGSSPLEITGRISRVLRERSIEAEYENEKAKVKCTTPEGVDCRVRLYRGRGKYNHGIIVEVQRRFGSSTNFKDHVQAILDAAEGNPPPPPPALVRSADALPLVSDSEDDYAPPSGTGSLNMVKKMFSHGGYDSQFLALQTLSSLTDAKKMGLATAKSVSTELVSGSNDVGSRVFDLLCRREKEEGLKLRSLALLIFANALEATEGQVDQVIRELVRPNLLKELDQAASNPRNAQMAARCLEYLYVQDHDQGELAARLEKAQEVGETRHAGLAAQTKRCLEKMMML